LGIASFVMAYVEDTLTQAALIEDPYTNSRFEAQRDCGATMNNTPIEVPRTPRSTIVTFEAFRASGFDDAEFFARLRAAGANPVRYLSFANVAVRVATGAIAGAVFARPSLWDCLAVALIAKEAGARVTTLHGAAVTGTDLDDGIVIAHPTWHEELLDVIANATQHTPQ
jgi:fructose-1,6-bisphosphatase/inositol monophosphatase family enzyme